MDIFGEYLQHDTTTYLSYQSPATLLLDNSTSTNDDPFKSLPLIADMVHPDPFATNDGIVSWSELMSNMTAPHDMGLGGGTPTPDLVLSPNPTTLAFGAGTFAAAHHHHTVSPSPTLATSAAPTYFADMHPHQQLYMPSPQQQQPTIISPAMLATPASTVPPTPYPSEHPWTQPPPAWATIPLSGEFTFMMPSPTVVPSTPSVSATTTDVTISSDQTDSPAAKRRRSSRAVVSKRSRESSLTPLPSAPASPAATTDAPPNMGNGVLLSTSTTKTKAPAVLPTALPYPTHLISPNAPIRKPGKRLCASERRAQQDRAAAQAAADDDDAEDDDEEEGLLPADMAGMSPAERKRVANTLSARRARARRVARMSFLEARVAELEKEREALLQTVAGMRAAECASCSR